MNIGLLLCDDVLEELQPQFGTYPQMFSRLLHQADKEFDLQVYDVRQGQFPRRTDECDAYLTTGSRHSVLDGFTWIEETIEFIRALDRDQKKFFGVCFGHQLMALALGGKVEQSVAGWGVGVSGNRVLEKLPWMNPFQSEIKVIVSHQDQVTEQPADTKRVASNDFCPLYMLSKKSHFLSIQGHPEFSARYSRELIERRQKQIPTHQVKAGLASLGVAPDDALIARWIINFFKYLP